MFVTEKLKTREREREKNSLPKHCIAFFSVHVHFGFKVFRQRIKQQWILLKFIVSFLKWQLSWLFLASVFKACLGSLKKWEVNSWRVPPSEGKLSSKSLLKGTECRKMPKPSWQCRFKQQILGNKSMSCDKCICDDSKQLLSPLAYSYLPARISFYCSLIKKLRWKQMMHRHLPKTFKDVFWIPGVQHGLNISSITVKSGYLDAPLNQGWYGLRCPLAIFQLP